MSDQVASVLPVYHDSAVTLYQSDARSIPIADGSVHCCVTSPPYWGLRDYGNDGQLGLESTPGEYVANIVDVFREVRRCLRDDGTLWLNLGDSYNGGGTVGRKDTGVKALARRAARYGTGTGAGSAVSLHGTRPDVSSLKPKDLVGIPWRVAFALQDDGWYLRSDIIWAKPNPMPESVPDRPTKAHEYVFLQVDERGNGHHRHGGSERAGECTMRNRRTVWTVATQPYPGAHFAVVPPALIKPCILAGCPRGGTVLDPFMGSGTTAYVAKEYGRKAVGCDLSAEYLELASRRLVQEVLGL